MRALRVSVLSALAGFLGIPPAQAYYHYVHYLRAPFNTPVYEKFDLNTLPNKTVTFFVVDSGPVNLGTNDDFSSVLSQVRQAALAWNSVDNSDLRVAFGGLESQGQPANTPGGDVVFTELPPGLLGMGGVTAVQTPTTQNGQSFFPVVRSIIQLTADTSQAPGPSYLESFFTTAVHEMGHALGLQHTWTAAAMSQDVIRDTSRARPIDADDIAGLSVLYGKANWNANYGSITGRVTANGQGVALASVVAIPAFGPAVSALTNPDGSYTISGVPPGNYFLYVHPLPPDAVPNNGSGLRLPVDQNGRPQAPSSSPFRTVFFTAGSSSGTDDLQQASNLGIAANSATVANFAVSPLPQSYVPMYDMITYSYNAAGAHVTPAYTNETTGLVTVVAQANPPLVTPIPQSITALGGFAIATQCQSANNITPPCFLPYSGALAVYLRVPAFQASPGPRHMVFTLPNGDLYILPDAFTLVQKDAPSISSVNGNSDGSVTVSGARFGLDSRVLFDGTPATILNTDGASFLTVTPPPGYSGQNASVIVYNSDGQNSTFYQSQTPPLYTYPVTGPPLFNVDIPTLAGNSSSIINIYAANMQFVDGHVTVGFGSTDVWVRRVWVLSPTHLAANVAVASGAAISTSEISVISGFQAASQPGAFFIQPANPSTPGLALPISNSDLTQSTITAGSLVTLYGSNLSPPSGGAQVLLNNQPVQVIFANASQINFAIPAGFPSGIAQVMVNNGAATSSPVGIQIDPAPPVIASVGELGPGSAPSPGDTLAATVQVSDLSIVGSTGRVQVLLSGVPMYVSQIKAGSQPGTAQVSFVVSQSFGSAPVSVVVAVDGVRSNPYSIIVR